LQDVPVITPARELVSEDGKQFPLGAAFTLTSRTTAAAVALRERGFQVRVFSIAEGVNEPTPYLVFDPCYVYLTKVIRVRGSSDPTINLGSLTKPTWLTPTLDRGMQRGRYLLVFEQSGDDRPVFRLRKDHTKEYFGSALYVEVLPVSQYTPREIAEFIRLINQKREELEGEAMTNSPSLPCYRYQAVTVLAGGAPEQQVARLEPCRADDTTAGQTELGVRPR
jgi:hypothetical protein